MLFGDLVRSMDKKDQLMQEALNIRNRLYEIANLFAGEETGSVAVMLHGACNHVVYASQMYERNK